MREDIIQFIWRLGLFNHADLKLTNGKSFKIIDGGILNRNAGPDFSMGRISIDGSIMVGNIEIHVKSSDWFAHTHQNDPAYNNVILHVVYEHTAKSPDLPTLELRSRISAEVMERINKLSMESEKIPCSNNIHSFPSELMSIWLEQVFVSWVQHKMKPLNNLRAEFNFGWEQLLYFSIGRAFGFGKNTLGFEQLCHALPLKYFYKFQGDILKLKALALGQSGLLNSRCSIDDIELLKSEYAHLKKAYKLNAINPVVWKFHRTRPGNFPDKRIIQFVYFIGKNLPAFSRLIEAVDLADLKHQINWQGKNKLPSAAMNSIILNAIIPVLFKYGKYVSDEDLSERAMDWAREIDPENNRITRLWKELHLPVASGFDSQAYLWLYKNWCLNKRCLECVVGCYLVQHQTKKAQHQLGF